MQHKVKLLIGLLFSSVLLVVMTSVTARPALAADPNPPTSTVKLIFIHHSTGGNWLADETPGQPSGGLGQALMNNNCFVSATNYGWGPDSIGDRTDIPNWPEWFTGPNSSTYLEALYNESGQNVGDFGAWSRLTADPGGENEIIMFKSCFPNSDLYGTPDDPPLDAPNDPFTVANAKAVYNDILTYFATRQDKLFIVITAPPLMESATTAKRAANARAFNNWLVDEWLTDYPHANVAVFDYYNVLTHPDNHHRWHGSQIEHIQAAATNVSAYPSGDSHPSSAGHRKATAEFVPLLNVYYNRWQAGDTSTAPTEQPTEQTPEAEPTSNPTPPAESPPTPTDTPADMPSKSPVGSIDDFESDSIWGASADAGSAITCGPETGAVHSGANALHLHYEILSDGWGDCGHHFDLVQDWSGGMGLSFWLRADGAPEWATLMLFSGDPNSPTPFEFALEIEGQDWTQMTFPWSDFVRSPWADDGGLDEIDPARITGYGISLGPGDGDMWIDDIDLVKEADTAPDPAEEAEKTEVAESTEVEGEGETSTSGDETSAEDGGGLGLCGSAVLPLSMAALALVCRRCKTVNSKRKENWKERE
ncbi:MAG: hypothetical protein GVY30_04880 [Chloroflexi bacterium]|jgi:hypothetical protein|nr:hypothetical protein [Chloroflexota bacterium]